MIWRASRLEEAIGLGHNDAQMRRSLTRPNEVDETRETVCARLECCCCVDKQKKDGAVESPLLT